jgi:hypothetical protein
MNLSLSYEDVEALLSCIKVKSLPLTNKSDLIRLVKKHTVMINGKVIFFKRDTEFWGSWIDAQEILRKNTGWDLPNFRELNDLESHSKTDEEITFKTNEYWALNDKNEIVIYNLKTEEIKSSLDYNSYLNHDGGDFSTFTPFFELNCGLRLLLRK